MKHTGLALLLSPLFTLAGSACVAPSPRPPALLRTGTTLAAVGLGDATGDVVDWTRPADAEGGMARSIEVLEVDGDQLHLAFFDEHAGTRVLRYRLWVQVDRVAWYQPVGDVGVVKERD